MATQSPDELFVMKTDVYIIGTTHKYQYKEKPASENRLFSAMLRQRIREFEIHSLAEECSLGALAEKKLQASSVNELSFKLGLPHLYCDPVWETRKKLGIMQRKQIEAVAWFNDEEISEAELDKREKEHFVKRERYWAKELLNFKTWPVLFVCGANHAESFQSVLAEHGLTGEVLENDWSA